MDNLVREAVETDLDALVEMGLRFRGTTSYSRFLAENPGQMRSMAYLLARGKTLLVSEREGKLTGMLGYVIHDHFLSGDKVAGEVFWWADKRGDGMALWREMENRAKIAGCRFSQMVAPNERVGKLYTHRGYEFVESTYQKDLWSGK